MRKGSVKQRIFKASLHMVTVALVIFLAVNMIVYHYYGEVIRDEWSATREQMTDDVELDGLFEDWMVHWNEFILFAVADGFFCIAVFVIAGWVFARNLTGHIMEPLDALADGAERIKNNELTKRIEYIGDTEFESVCHTFNDMCKSVLTEQEKNRKYEKARADMIAGISHDLRTPLTAVRGTIKGLIDGIASTPEQQRKFLQTAYRRTGDMETLLEQLFYCSTMETGNIPLFCRNIEIAGFLCNYAKEKRELPGADTEEIIVHTKGIAAEICADPEQLRRILDNLLENSRKYGERIPLRVEIILHRIPQGLDICFRDNGAGMPEDKISHVFEEFYRGDESRNRTGGNGLGLYIVKYLMDAMGGSVRAENADGFAVHLGFPVAKRKGA